MAAPDPIPWVVQTLAEYLPSPANQRAWIPSPPPPPWFDQLLRLLETWLSADPSAMQTLERLRARPDDPDRQAALRGVLAVIAQSQPAFILALEALQPPVHQAQPGGLLDFPEGLAGDGDESQATYRSWMPTPLQTPATPPQAAPPASAPPETGRVLQAEITEHPLDRPLDMTSEFTLAFFVEEAARANLQAAGRFEEGGLFQDSAQLETLHVVVTSQDFTIHTRTPQSLRVPSQGRSRNKARFDLEPKHSGPGEVTAVFYKENNFIQGLSVTLNVAEGARAIEKVLPLGRPLEASGLLLARDVMLLFKKVVDGFDVVAVGEVSGMAHLPIKEHYLHSLIAQARQALLKVVYLGKDAQNQMGEMDAYGNLPGAVEFVFQAGLEIPEAFSTRALHILAEAGVALFKGLFFGDGFPQEARQLGDRLRELSEKQPLRLQIVSQEFLLPWGLLYPARRFDPTTIQPEGFLGFKHRIEHIPLMSGMQALDRRIRSNQPRLAVSLNFDPQIDAQFGLPLLQPQRERWAQYQSDGRVELIERSSAAAFIDALINPTTPDQILYFFGHAETRGLDEPGGPGESSLLFGEGDLLTLTRLKNETFDDVRLPGAPLVFINACESAELSPLFYGGFMPFFTTRGARGLIGTECRVPALFAAAWAQRFFELFLQEGETLGAAFLKLRREFYTRYNNPLGLLYALYCDGDTLVEPSL